MHRLQTLATTKLQNVRDRIEIDIPARFKTSRFNSPNPTLILPYFTEEAVCPAQTLMVYIERTSSLRGETKKLFLTSCTPYCPASKDTLAWWVREVLNKSGVDAVFTAHSTRHAVTSKADQRGVSLEIIRKTAGWTPSSSVFGQLYNRTVKPGV